jgi:4-hydroxy-3-methylbut-2-enyl diphosphate reductase
MHIIRAEHLGMCFGVRDAIALAERKAREQPLTILGDLVHNPAVLGKLRAQGVVIEHDPAAVKTRTAMITAHGASDRAKNRARAEGLEIFEGTCPLVHHAHQALARLVAEGRHLVIIGKRNHVEVRGLTEDLENFDIVECEADIRSIQPYSRIGVVSQTTQPIDRVKRLVEQIRRHFPEADIRFSDTVCQPTKQRQRAAADLAQASDVVIVVGGAQSNNTRELVNTCARFCSRVHHVQDASELDAAWYDGAETVGITAGTSTPDYLIDAVEQAIRRSE